MPKPSRPSRFTLLQALILLALFIIFAAYEYFSQKADPAQETPEPLQATSGASLPAKTNPAPRQVSPTTKARFDYYLLALSWSPDYCMTDAGKDDAQQCSIGKKLGLVVHGLWPQNQKGYPTNCSLEKLDKNVKAEFPGLFPSDALYDHEWEKHGTCTGLTPREYLSLTKTLREKVQIPPEYRAPEQPFRTTSAALRSAFVAVNPAFPPNAFAVDCSDGGRYFQELQVCFDRSGSPLECGAEVLKDAAKSCGQPNFLVRSVR